MHDFLVERKVLAHKANRIDDVIEKRDWSAHHFIVKMLAKQIQVIQLHTLVPWIKLTVFFNPI